MTYLLNLRRRSFDGEVGITFDNDNELLVPGFGLPVPIELPARDRFAHGFSDWSQNRLTARELAMLRLMNSMTDRAEWHLQILHNPAIVATWANEAQRDDPLISQTTWNWCLAELRDKAALYDQSKITHVWDSASRICKSDHLLPSSLLKELAAEIQSLPEMVDPDMFPLVYGSTRVVSSSHVGCIDAIERSGRGSASSPQIWRCPRYARARCDGSMRASNGRRGRGRGGLMACHRCRRPDTRDNSVDQSWEPRGDRFSAYYQWLPSDFSFRQKEPRIRISSYINNLHPRQNSSLYRIIEKCVEASIIPWNETLIRDKGRTPERIRTYGVQWSPEPPHESDLEDLEVLMQNGDREAMCGLRTFLEEPDNHLSPVQSIDRYPMLDLKSDLWRQHPSTAMRVKYNCVKRWLHPEPGVAFTYQDWKKGRNNMAIVPPRYKQSLEADHKAYTVDLERDFAKQGLQIVVEIGGIDLTPQRPSK